MSELYHSPAPSARRQLAQILADQAVAEMWDHWKLYKHGWDEPGAAPSQVVDLFEALLPAAAEPQSRETD